MNCVDIAIRKSERMDPRPIESILEPATDCVILRHGALVVKRTLASTQYSTDFLHKSSWRERDSTVKL